MKLVTSNDPSFILILLNSAILSTTGTVISSAIEKIKEEFPKLPEVDATGPFLRVIVDGLGVISEVSTKKLINAVEDLRDFGKYPIFLASATTFSLSVALSMNTSFATMLALYEVM